MSDRPDRTNLGRGWELADRKEGWEILEKVTVSRKKNKARARRGFREMVRRSMH